MCRHEYGQGIYIRTGTSTTFTTSCPTVLVLSPAPTGLPFHNQLTALKEVNIFIPFESAELGEYSGALKSAFQGYTIDLYLVPYIFYTVKTTTHPIPLVSAFK